MIDEPKEDGFYWVRTREGHTRMVERRDGGWDYNEDRVESWSETWDRFTRVHDPFPQHTIDAIEPVLGPSWSRSLHDARLAMLDSERVERERIAREWPNVTPLDPPAFEWTRFPVPKGPSGP